MNPKAAEDWGLAQYDSADYLCYEEDITAHLLVVMAEDDEGSDLARTGRMSQSARDTGLTREGFTQCPRFRGKTWLRDGGKGVGSSVGVDACSRLAISKTCPLNSNGIQHVFIPQMPSSIHNSGVMHWRINFDSGLLF